VSFIYSKINKDLLSDKGIVNDPKGLLLKHIQKAAEIYRQFDLTKIKMAVEKNTSAEFKKGIFSI
jgi:hypothetical protein